MQDSFTSARPLRASSGGSSTVASVQASYVRLDTRADVPDGWTSHVHPRGWVYFRSHKYRVVTDEDVRMPEVSASLSELCTQLPFGELPNGFEIHMLGHAQHSINIVINHNQCVAAYNLKEVAEDSVPLCSTSKLTRHRRLYWTYIQNHPVHVQLPQHAFSEAVDALQAFQLDYVLLGPRSMAVFSREECRELLDTLSRILEHEGASLPSCTEFVAWILRRIYTSRNENSFGKYTRKQFDEATSPPEPTQPDSRPARLRFLFTALVNGPFFGIPNTYHSHTAKASEFHGRLAGLQEAWQSYTKQLTREYSDFVIAATVLLSATIGFLAVPDIAILARSLCTISVFASLGSVITGIFFVWRHHRQVSSSNTLAYIHNVRNGPLGLTGHALLLSLPPVLLVWAVLTFTAAVISYSTQDTPGKIGLAVIFAAFVVVFILVVIGVYTFSHIWNWKGQR